MCRCTSRDIDRLVIFPSSELTMVKLFARAQLACLAVAGLSFNALGQSLPEGLTCGMAYFADGEIRENNACNGVYTYTAFFGFYTCQGFDEYCRPCACLDQCDPFYRCTGPGELLWLRAGRAGAWDSRMPAWLGCEERARPRFTHSLLDVVRVFGSQPTLSRQPLGTGLGRSVRHLSQ